MIYRFSNIYFSWISKFISCLEDNMVVFGYVGV